MGCVAPKEEASHGSTRTSGCHGRQQGSPASGLHGKSCSVRGDRQYRPGDRLLHSYRAFRQAVSTGGDEPEDYTLCACLDEV